MPALLSHIAELPAARLYLVAGPAASGKTTFSNALSHHLGALVLSMDHYYVDEEQVPKEHDPRYGMQPQWESPDAYDVRKIQSDVRALLTTGFARIPSYSFALNRRVGWQEISLAPEQALIVEGLYAIRFVEYFQACTDSFVKIFIEAHLNERRARSRVRDVIERGKLAEEFEKRYHFVSLGERRWGLTQVHKADFIVEANHKTRDAIFWTVLDGTPHVLDTSEKDLSG